MTTAFSAKAFWVSFGHAVSQHPFWLSSGRNMAPPTKGAVSKKVSLKK